MPKSISKNYPNVHFCSCRPGSEWERVNKLVDFNTKANKNTKDMSRMRSIMLQLKQNPPIKNAE